MLLLAVVVAFGIAVAAHLSQDRLRSADVAIAVEDGHGQIAQLEVDFANFLSDLTRFAAGDTWVTQEVVAQRFDTLWSRAGILENDSLVATYDQSIGAIPVLMARLRSNKAAVLALDRADEATNRRLIASFATIGTEIRRLSLNAFARRDDLRTEAQAELSSGGSMASLVFHGALALAALLALVLVLDLARARILRAENRRLVRQAESADMARTRFLSMMSHELRTPMNGVLGLLQLLKQSRLTDSQERLVDQAERSGRQMTDLLGDILEFSDLEAERLEIEQEAYRPRALAASIEELVAAASLRNRTPVTVECARGAPEWVMGDFSRLRQALSHLAGNLLSDTRVRALRLSLAHDRGRLRCTFGVDTFTRRRAGADDGSLPGTAPDSLGLTITRGLIGMMNGRIRIAELGPGSHELRIEVPAGIVYPRRDSVRIVETSETSAMLMRQVIEEAGLRVWSPRHAASLVAVVLLELPVADEATAVERLRAAHPGAMLIAVGSTLDVNRFDGICSGAMDHLAIRQHLDRSIGAVQGVAGAAPP